MAGLLACAGPFFMSQGAKKKAELVRLDMLYQPFYNRDYKMTVVKLLQ